MIGKGIKEKEVKWIEVAWVKKFGTSNRFLW